jgi:hypothetical protein
MLKRLRVERARTSISLPKDLLEAGQQLAEFHGLTFSALVARALRPYCTLQPPAPIKNNLNVVAS